MQNVHTDVVKEGKGANQLGRTITEVGGQEQGPEKPEKPQCIKNEEAEERTKGERREISDSEESGMIE